MKSALWERAAHLDLTLEISKQWGEEMSQWSRAFVALAEGRGSVTSIQMAVLNHLLQGT